MGLTSIEKLTRTSLINLIKKRMVTVEDAVTCHSGEATTTYLDIPAVLGDSESMQLAARTLTSHLIQHRLTDMTAIAGPQMGSIPLVLGFTAHWGDGLKWAAHWGDGLKWAIVRDHAKDHGLGSIFVGTDLGPGDKVILTDDVVSSGRSLMETVGAVQATGAQVIAVVPLVDRGDAGAEHFAKIGIPYLPVLTYEDLGLPPLGVK